MPKDVEERLGNKVAGMQMRRGLLNDEEKRLWDQHKDFDFAVRRETIGGSEKRCDTV